MTDTVTSVPALYLRRTYSASPARVYEAWTTSELLARFLGPGDVQARVPEFDARIGGRFRIEMHRPDAEAYVAYGEIRELVPNARIVMTWTWEEDDPADERETMLTIELTPNGTGTDLELTHTQLASLDSRERHAEGWNAILDQFAELA